MFKTAPMCLKCLIHMLPAVLHFLQPRSWTTLDSAAEGIHLLGSIAYLVSRCVGFVTLLFFTPLPWSCLPFPVPSLHPR